MFSKKRAKFSLPIPSSRLRRVPMFVLMIIALGAANATRAASAAQTNRAARADMIAPTNFQEGAQGNAEVTQAITAAGTARVLLLLDDRALATAPQMQRPSGVAQIQSRVLSNLTAAEFQTYRRFQFVPGLAGTVNAAGLAKLQADPLVRAIQIDHPGQAHLLQSVPALNADFVHTNYGVTGKGVTVAVLDSGIDTDHPDLSTAIVAQHCFTQGACPPSLTTESNSAEDDNGHGTHVAGIVTADGVVSGEGFAPDAKIVAVRVLDANGNGLISDWVAGLDWVRANLTTTPVQIVNMSLGTFALYTGNCTGQEPLLANAVSQLRAQGVTVFASSGNQGSSTQIAAPACNSGVIAVGATYDSDVGREPDSGTYQSGFGGAWPTCADTTTSLQTITCFTNSNSQLDLLAPGAPIVSTYVGGGTATFWGTSQASPTAAGIAALMLERNPTLTPDEIESALKASGPQVLDTRNNQSVTRINARNAVDLVSPVAPQAVSVSGPLIGTANIAYPFSASVTPLTATVPITYRWQASDLATTEISAGISNTISFTWPTPGLKTVTVTASNAGGSVTQTHQINIAAVAPTSVLLQGPSQDQSDIGQTFSAVVAPLTTTLPLTYVWQADTGATLTHTSGLSDSATFTWTSEGMHTVTVHASNSAGVVSATRMIDIVATLLTVSLSSAITPTVGLSIPLLAEVSPFTESLPITYTWLATGQATLNHTAGLSDSVVYRWDSGGPVTVTVVIRRDLFVASTQRTWLLVDPRIFMPMLLRDAS